MIGLILAAAVSWPMQYNAGVTAYRSNDFAAATSAFEQGTASPDHSLQERSFYNLGNTAYRLGEIDPTKAQSLWERALKSYETALALDPKDEDAKFNHEFVHKKLEELKKQQEQQQQKQQQNQKNEDEQKKEENQKQQEQQQQAQQEKNEPKNQEQAKPEPSQQKQEEKKQQEQQPQQAQAGNLDKQQAKALLENLREDERNWNFFPEVQMKNLQDTGEPAKDW